MDKENYKKVARAREILDLEEEATLKEIRSSYRSLSLKYHPDRCPESRKKKCKERFQEINRAYEVIMDYCAGYRYSFKEDSIEENDPDREYREHMERFYDDWWFDLKNKKDD